MAFFSEQKGKKSLFYFSQKNINNERYSFSISQKPSVEGKSGTKLKSYNIKFDTKYFFMYIIENWKFENV